MRRRGSAMALTVAAGCSGSGESAAEGGPQVIRFAFAPDPVWDYMNDNGIIVKWEEEHNIQIVTSSTWDEFTYFAGGHGDIVSMATQEMPVLEEETGIKTVTFGKYNFLRIPLLRRARATRTRRSPTSRRAPRSASPGRRRTPRSGACSPSSCTTSTSASAAATSSCRQRPLREPENLLRGDCEAAAIIPEAAIPQLRKGELEVMYDGKLPFQLYKEFAPDSDGKKHVMGNNFTATEEWYDANPELAAKFLELWEEGIDSGWSRRPRSSASYPQHFAVESRRTSRT